jgi:hypothetical protein
VPPSEKLTVPVGLPVAGEVALTVADTVALVPYTVGPLDVTAVALLPRLIVNVAAGVWVVLALALKLAAVVAGTYAALIV